MSLKVDIRCLRYRLKRQGMLELDAWLSDLDDVLLSGDARAIAAIDKLLQCEPPLLLAMMHGDKPLPGGLEAYLGK